MIRVVLIDDEYFFRQALKKMIAWEQLGFQVVGEASNGKDGCDVIAELRPDVIFVDINMPVMDGFDLCAELCRRKIYPKIIFLTGYEEFSYAKLAIQYGAKNYLLKPVQPAEVENTLQELAEEMAANKERKEDNVSEDLQYLIAIRQKYLLELLNGKVQKEENLRNIVTLLNLDGNAPFCCAVSIFLEHSVTPTNSLTSQYMGAISATNDAFAHYVHCFGLFENTIVGILCLHNPVLTPLLQISRSLIDHLHISLFKSVTVAFGSVESSFMTVTVSHKNAVDTLCNRLILGDNMVLDYHSIYQEKASASIVTKQMRARIQQALLYYDLHLFSRLMVQLFEEFETQNCTYHCIRLSCMSVIAIVVEFYQKQLAFPLSFVLKTGTVFEQMTPMNSLTEMREWLISELSEYIIHAKKQHVPKRLTRVEEIKLYISENLSDSDLNIDNISQKFYISYHHLCALFKKEAGITINEYIMDCRMGRAKELMENGVSNISYIAMTVGFRDPNYFSRCFKKYFGVSPSKYAENFE